MKVLVAEDDKYIRDGLREILETEGYIVIVASNGKEALDLFKTQKPDFICLDIMMPEMNGYDVCREVRKVNSNIPVIFISAKSEEIDKVLGLELGADDFIVKPFGVKEVIARIRAVTRRVFNSSESIEIAGQFEYGKYKILPNELMADDGERQIELSYRDIQILDVMRQNKGRLVKRETLMKKCWGVNAMKNSRTLDQHLSQLRKKIEENPKDPNLIITVHGFGYRYDG